MLSTSELWVEIAAAFAVALLIPTYMGFIHMSLVGAAAYAALAGLAMTLGEELHFPRGERQLSFWDIFLRIAAIAGVGGIAYGLALILI